MNKSAVFFPGIGYTVDKPLMHYSRKMAQAHGYTIRLLPYGGFPDKVRGDRGRMEESCALALRQAEEMLRDVDFDACDEILFVGKSIGTIVAAAIADKSGIKERVRLILYTPLEETFSFGFGEAIAFTGSADPWVGGGESKIPDICRRRGVCCEIFPGADHSLETGNVLQDLEYMKAVMQRTEAFMMRQD